MASHLFLITYAVVRPTHDETHAPHETISALDLAVNVPMFTNPAYEGIPRLAPNLADVSMTRNPAYVSAQPHRRDYMTSHQDYLTEPSPAKSRPLPCPPEIEMKRKQRQMQNEIPPTSLPLPVPMKSTSIVPSSDDALCVDEAVVVPFNTVAHPDKVCTVIYIVPVDSGHIMVKLLQ